MEGGCRVPHTASSGPWEGVFLGQGTDSYFQGQRNPLIIKMGQGWGGPGTISGCIWSPGLKSGCSSQQKAFLELLLRDAAVRTSCETKGIMALQVGPSTHRGTGSWPPSLPRATCPSWGSCLIMVISAVPVTSATAEGCGRAGRRAQGKFQVAKGPRKLGVGCAQEGSGRRGRIPDDHAHHLSCACKQSQLKLPTPAPHHCLFPPRGLNCCGHTEWVGQECPGPALCRGSPSHCS